MELTLDNLVNYILEQEYKSFTLMIDYEDALGENSPETLIKRANWNAYFKIAKEFGFSDRLKR